MNDQQMVSKAAYERILADAQKEANRSPPLSPKFDYIKIADQLRRQQKASWGYNILRPLQRLYKDDAYFNFVLALICRDRQDMDAANQAIICAASVAPTQPDIAFARAQIAFESWRPSVAEFRYAERLAPSNLAVKKNLALALVADRETEKAQSLLELTLEFQPDWLDGHKQLVSIKQTTGYEDVYGSLRRACATRPDHLKLRMAWFYLLAQTKDWDSARQVLHDAPKDNALVEMADIYLRAESGRLLTDAELTGKYAQTKDPGFDLCLTRYHLRHGEIAKALRIAERYIRGPKARLFWPYVSICWRLSDDSRFKWLEQNVDYASVVDLPVTEQQLSRLADLLRSLHRHENPYPEQSVKGGTQTDRNLLLHPDKRIQKIKHRFLKAISNYIDELPEAEESHPLLGQAPDELRFSGAWSVALASQGYHSTHTHIHGWLSSAFYVALPSEMGPSPMGCLSFGTAPPELGLNLAPLTQVKPAAGRLVLFPSYYWHGTEPFQAGERLSIAFDVGL